MKIKYTLLAISLCTLMTENLVAQPVIMNNQEVASIQGRHFKDRINGIYDLSISDEQVIQFLNHLQAAVQKKDVKGLAKLISYPCRWKKTVLTNSNQFIKHYSAVMTPEIESLILNSTIDDLFVNSQGFMLGNGEIWFIPTTGIFVFN